MDDSLHDTDLEIIDLTEIIELGPRIPGAASADPAAEEGALSGGGDGPATDAAGGRNLPADDAGEQGAAAAAPPADDAPAEDAPEQGGAEEAGGAVTAVPHGDAPMPEGGKDAPASSLAGIDQLEDDADALGAESDAGADEPALALMKTVGEVEGGLSAV
ncbi:MAG: hypothetical protein IKS68_06005, partial [Mailhella sp.]|nr:hypothetical protein [Mailhella sp.]